MTFEEADKIAAEINSLADDGRFDDWLNGIACRLNDDGSWRVEIWVDPSMPVVEARAAMSLDQHSNSAVTFLHQERARAL